MTSRNASQNADGAEGQRRPPATVTLAEALDDWDDAVVDGPVAVCPVCTGVVDHLTLARDVEGLEPACCHDCGALLAA